MLVLFHSMAHHGSVTLDGNCLCVGFQGGFLIYVEPLKQDSLPPALTVLVRINTEGGDKLIEFSQEGLYLS